MLESHLLGELQGGKMSWWEIVLFEMQFLIFRFFNIPSMSEKYKCIVCGCVWWTAIVGAMWHSLESSQTEALNKQSLGWEF